MTLRSLPSTLRSPGSTPCSRALVLILAAALAAPASGLTPARTKENVQRKAVIVGHDARLYRDARGDDGTEAPFMQIYFLLEGVSGGRVPVSLGPNEDAADGWLAEGSFAEWNTLQMVDFEPQSGRELAKIYADSSCAQRFGTSGKAPGCDELGSEPRRAGVRDDYSLLIPVFESQRDVYKGGFVRVTMEGPEVVPQVDANADAGSGRAGNGSAPRLGYDLILVVDATASMEQWFQPTTEVLQGFVREVERSVRQGEVRAPFHVGLLFYRDRKVGNDCDIGFLTRWAVDLTGDVDEVANALSRATEARCGSDEPPESVYDALNRALLDPKWHDGYFKVLLLVGDAPPHPPSNTDKNPLGFTVEKITEMSQERNVRILSFKVGTDEVREFRDLALSGSEAVLGRFRAIAPDPADYKNALATAMREEWALLTKANQVQAAGISGEELERDPSLAPRWNIDDYELPIIVANLPPSAAGKRPPEFVEGWVPKRIGAKLAVGEHVFMRQGQIKILANVVETIALAAQDGITEGSEAFVSTLRNALAGMLNVRPDELFRSGESLASMLRKADVLPFKTTTLSFTAEEINTWKPADFERLNQILGEKIDVLREYVQKPTNLRYFGDKAHVYVPRNLFP